VPNHTRAALQAAASNLLLLENKKRVCGDGRRQRRAFLTDQTQLYLGKRTSKAIYIVLSNKNWSLASGSKRGRKMQKRVIVKIKKDNTELSLREVLEKIKEIQDQHPDLDIFFDGDEYAICSRPRKASP
jgi:hypothetical protein